MGKILLFTIPMYSMSKKLFDEKWGQYYQHNEVEKEHRRFYKPRNEWKFNQVIAYIEIYKNNYDIDFEIYKSRSSIFSYNTIHKGYEHLYTIGNHFYVDPSETNDSIKQTILAFLDGFKSELGFKGKRQFLLLDEFNLQFDLMNVRNLFYPE